MGAGGVGGYYGARLAAAGHDVHFVARGPHADALRARGLRVRSEAGDIQLDVVRVVEEPAEIGSAELVLVAVKLWDTEVAARAIAPLIAPDTAVVSLQNGVDKDDVLCSLVGAEQVVGGVTYLIARIAEPGVIGHTGLLHRVVIGELAGGTSQRAAHIVAAFCSAGVEARVSPEIRRETWAKLAFLAASSALTAVTRLEIGTVRSHPATRALLRDAIAEGAAVARAEGVALGDDFVTEQLRFVDSLPASGRASMANDLLLGNRLELEWLSGAVVRRGERLGVPTPVHGAIYAVLAPYAGGAPTRWEPPGPA
jgi:2-dehydropantoate 2-reductase